MASGGNKQEHASAIRTLLWLIVIFGAVYTAIWFYYAQNIRSRVEARIEKTFDSDTFHYSDIRLSGYPFAFNVTIEEAEFTGDLLKGVRVRAPERQGIEIRTHLFLPDITVRFPQQYEIVSGEHTDHPLEMQLEFGAAPEAMIALTKTPLEMALVQGSPFPKGVLLREVTGVTYAEEALRLINKENGAVLLTIPESIFGMTHQNVGDDKQDAAVQLHVNDMELTRAYYEGFYRSFVQDFPGMSDSALDKFIGYMADFQEKTGPSSFALDMSYRGKRPDQEVNSPNFNMHIRQLETRNALYTASGDGKLFMSDADIFPYGWFRVRLRNYKQIVYHYANYFNALLGIGINQIGNLQSPLYMAILGVDQKRLDDFITFLETIGAVSDDGQELSFLFYRDKNTEFMLGDKTFSQVLLQFQNHVLLMNQLRKKAEEKQQSTSENPEIKAEDALKEVIEAK